MTGVTTTIHVGDVLIVGGGGAGVLTALRCQELGLCGLLVDTSAIAAAQSQHSHGYLHDGSIYPDASREFVKRLAQSRRRWLEMLERFGIEPITRRGNIGFSNTLTQSYVEAAWMANGLRPKPSDTSITAFPGVTTWYRTPEPAYDFTKFWSAAASELDAVATARARVRRVRVDRAGVVSGVEADMGGVAVLLTAGAYVLAAGNGNAALIESAIGMSGPIVTRPSFMLVVDSADLPKESVVLPGPDHGGLFLVPRQHADGHTLWLVGDFISGRGTDPAVADERSWRRGMVRLLRQVSDVLDRPDVRIGSYVAPKAEMRPDIRYLGADHRDTFGVANLVAISPTKLSLAAALADDTADMLKAMVAASGKVKPPHNDVSSLAPLTVGAEHWLSVALSPVGASLLDPGDAG